MEPYWLLSSESEGDEVKEVPVAAAPENQDVKEVTALEPDNKTAVNVTDTPKRAKRKRVKSIPIGFICVNKLMNNAIGKVLSMARARDKNRAKRKNDPEKVKLEAAGWYQKHKQKVLKKNKKWKQSNKVKLNSTRNQYSKRMRQNSPAFVLAQRCRNRLRHCLEANGAKKGNSTLQDVGISCSALASYLGLENSIKGREIDHIFPLSAYDWNDTTSQSRSMHYTNLQPLSHIENIEKFDKLPTKAMAAKVDRDKWPPGITEDMLPDIYPGWATPLRMHAAPTPGASSSTDTTPVVDESMSSSESDSNSEDSDDSDDSDSD
jgi:hypothetical protein